MLYYAPDPVHPLPGFHYKNLRDGREALHGNWAGHNERVLGIQLVVEDSGSGMGMTWLEDALRGLTGISLDFMMVKPRTTKGFDNL